MSPEQQLIIASDIYDAMRDATRPYFKGARDHANAMGVVRREGLSDDIVNWFDQNADTAWNRIANTTGMRPLGSQLSLFAPDPNGPLPDSKIRFGSAGWNDTFGGG